MVPISLSAGCLALVSLSSAAWQQVEQAAPATEIRVPGKRAVARVWNAPGADGRSVPHYSLALDGEHFSAARETDYDLRLRYGRFDPRTRAPEMPASLRAEPGSRLFVVQYWTQGIEDYRSVLREQGAEIHLFLANHANVVEMDAAAVERVRALPFVRAVVPFHPAYKLEEELLAALAEGKSGPVQLNLLTLRRGGQAPVVRWIEESGGTVEHVSEPTYLMSGTIDLARLPELAALDEVQWIDRWAAPEDDMNRARGLHGADYVESMHGLTGAGVRIEVMDSGFDTTHPDMQQYLLHNTNSPGSHGTCTAGILVGDGIGRPLARGAAPDAFLVVANYTQPYAGGSRYNHTAQLVNPALPYKCVVQSNSWGSGLTTAYNSLAQNLDLILFDLARISICQSQSNEGTRSSRSEAWAKNVISVGGIYHRDTTTKSDDTWAGGASIGPAADGRIKPDMASFFDDILCPDRPGANGYDSTDYVSNFGGTSGATPIVAGHLALVYEMWHQGLFGNPTGPTAFEDAPNNTTAKALLINGASPWTFSGTTHDLTRVHQGWGHPDLERLSTATARMFLVDESDVLSDLQSKTYALEVLPGQARLRVTLVYRDPPGTTSSTIHRINDLDLTVTSPASVVYHGNYGLTASNQSQSGGSANTVDTVENVFVINPAAGIWSVMVSATEVNQDSHVETGAVDVDYALVVSGAEPPPAAPPVAPSHLRGRGATRLVHLWFDDESDDELAFELQRSLDGVNFTPLASLAANDASHDDASVTPNTTYHYRVRATNAAGASAWSNVASVRTNRADRHGPP